MKGQIRDHNKTTQSLYLLFQITKQTSTQTWFFSDWHSPWPCWWIHHPGTRLCQRHLLGRSWCAWSQSIYPLGCQSALAGSFPLLSWHPEGWPHAGSSADHRHIYTDDRRRIARSTTTVALHITMRSLISKCKLYCLFIQISTWSSVSKGMNIG